jgi:hypothetical protein
MSKFVDVNIGLDDVDRDGIIDDIVSTELERTVMRVFGATAVGETFKN